MITFTNFKVVLVEAFVFVVLC